MAISNVDIMRMNQYLQGKVESFYDIIPESTKMNLQELFVVLMKMFRKGLETGRKDLYLLNILIAMDSIIDELGECGEGLDMDSGEEARKLLDEYQEYVEKKGKSNDEIIRRLTLFSNYVYIGDSIYDLRNNDKKDENEEEQQEEEKEEVEEKSEEEQKQEMYQKIANSFTSLNVENDDLRKQIELLKKEKRSLQKSVDSKTRQLDSANKEILSLRQERKENTKKVADLTGKVNRLTKTVEDQSEKLKKNMTNSDETIRRLGEISKLRSQVEEYRKKERATRNPKTNEQFDSVYASVKRSILNMLMNDICCFDDIEQELKREKKLLSRAELFACLQEIQKEYQVNVIIGNGGMIYYRIETPDMPEAKKIIVPVTRSAFTDVALTADWHQYPLDNEDEHKLDSLYEYCNKFGIHMIWNLGDVFDYVDYKIVGSNLAKESYHVYKRIEKLANNMPYDSNITQYILGGNHDEYLRRLKLEVLNILTSIRPDMYSLGYNHAFISLGSALFGLHHPNKQLNTLKEYRNYLEQYYRSNNLDINYDDVYMNLFGHFHMFRYFHQDGYMSVPSLTRDSKGAIHMRVYVNEKGHVSFVEFIPLRYEHKVGLVREKPIQYKKVVKR